MEKQISAFIETLKKDKRFDTFDKASTKQAIVIRLLSLLGWDIFDVDEVKPDHTVKNALIDFVLRPDNIDTVFIAVESPDEELKGYQKDLLGTALKEDINLAVLTNGRAWWFYLALSEGTVEQKRYCAIDLQKHPSAESAARFIELLEKDNVAKGKALKIAKSIQVKRQRKLIEKSMGKAWHRIISEPHETLVNLFGETVENLCGYKPDKEMITGYLAELGQNAFVEETAPQAASSFPSPQTYKGREITGFTLGDDSFKLKAWDEFLLKLCEVLMQKHDKDIERLLWHSVDNKYYFREDPDELRLPVNIEGTNILVETHLSPEDTVKVAHSILATFGFSGDDLDIKSKKK